MLIGIVGGIIGGIVVGLFAPGDLITWERRPCITAGTI